MKITKRSFLCGLALLCLVTSPASAEEKGTNAQSLASIESQIRELKEQMERERQNYEKRLKAMQQQIEALSKREKMEETAKGDAEEALAAEIAKSTDGKSSQGTEKSGSSIGSVLQSMNPEIAISIDTVYYNDDTENGAGDLIGEVAGFGHTHAHDDGHDHAHYFEKGFNLREVELYFGAAVDPYFNAYTTLSYHFGEFELEEAVFQTTFLPAGFQVKGGKFLSDFSRINRQHPHEWDFVDRPLISQLVFGEHGLLETGAQLSWLAPTPFHLLLGLEAAQGDNEQMFNYIDGDNLPDYSGPRLWVGWFKVSPNLPRPHALQIGFFGSYGKSQEAHDGDGNEAEDHWFDGYGSFYGADFVYKYDSARAHGQGDWLVQGEYLYRRSDLDVIQHNLNPSMVGRSLVKNQDGFYVQGVYGFLPRWQTGLRLDMAGLTNQNKLPSGEIEDFGKSYRFSGMIDWAPSEFSKLRFQTSYCDWDLDHGEREKFWQVFVQAVINFGTHGAHGF